MTVQTRGTQRFLMTWETMQPEEALEARPWIIDAERPAPVASLRIVDEITGRVVHEPPPLGPSGPGNERDPRPELCRVVTIKPRETLVRLVDISKMLARLPDGAYQIHLEPRRMWWCERDKESFAEEGDGRIPQRLWNSLCPPAMLESDDIVELRIENGKVAES
ncbi:hypothetical protein KCU85_g8469, partial [Aureobasidium melanogenum]